MLVVEWLNEPPRWRAQDDELTVVTGENTDFWRETHYGFVRDDGHLYFERASGDFTAEVTVSGDYRHLYDQAGLMLRLDERTWIKAGVEYVEGRRMLSVVVTRDFSDWSTVPLSDAPNPLRFRLSRHGTAVRVEWAPADLSESFALLRLAYLPNRDPALVGPMCCSPQRAGFEARFQGFRLGAAIPRDLHGTT
jgi:regulation of enolase protein 1 (concanavalin A-like superfamily)